MQLLAVLLLLILGFGLINPDSPPRAPLQYGKEDFRQYINEDGISDERAIYYSYLGLFSSSKRSGFPGSKFSGEEELRRINPANATIIRTSWVYSSFGSHNYLYGSSHI